MRRSLLACALLAGALGIGGHPLRSSAAETADETAAFEQLLTRSPSDAEREKCLTFLRQQAERLTSTSERKPQPGPTGSEPGPAKEPHQRARENLIHVLYNYNEFLTIR